jgi:hypothetical protein
MDILYKGSNPPGDFSDLEPVETNVSIETLTGYYTEGRQANDNYNIIVRQGGSRLYWYPPVITPPTPRILDGASFREYAYRVLGTLQAPQGTDDEKDVAGLVRYGGILKAAKASDDEGVIAALDQYGHASNFHRAKVQIFLGLLASVGIVELGELQAIIGNWPQG